MEERDLGRDARDHGLLCKGGIELCGIHKVNKIAVKGEKSAPYQDSQ